jgi:hypothetical protein
MSMLEMLRPSSSSQAAIVMWSSSLRSITAARNACALVSYTISSSRLVSTFSAGGWQAYPMT